MGKCTEFLYLNEEDMRTSRLKDFLVLNRY